LSEIENIYYAVWKRTGGRCVDEFSESQIANLGRLLGRIHETGKKKDASNRLKLTTETMCLKPISYLRENSIIPAALEISYFNHVKTITGIFDDLIQNVPYHRIHGDCHIGNLLFGDNGFFFLDFDDFCSGPAVQDFWMLLVSSGQERIKNLNILLENYRLFSDFEDKWLNLIEPLRALRFVHYAGWISKRWDDPAFKDAFPFFGTHDYWQKEINDLDDQIKIINKTNYVFTDNKIDMKVTEPQEELTNEDFFWDMKKDSK
jgi:Ser/Thr protein kinase RdoA (MazF antagonist)